MLFIEQQPLDQMIADAIHTYPDECCGFLFGKEEGAQRRIISIFVVGNAKEGDKRRRFEISARDYLNAERFADENEWQLLGVYHSHPDHPAIPSEADRVAAQPFFSYIIISVRNKDFAGLRSWQLNDQFQFEEEKINNQFIIQEK